MRLEKTPAQVDEMTRDDRARLIAFFSLTGENPYALWERAREGAMRNRPLRELMRDDEQGSL